MAASTMLQSAFGTLVLARFGVIGIRNRTTYSYFMLGLIAKRYQGTVKSKSKIGWFHDKPPLVVEVKFRGWGIFGFGFGLGMSRRLGSGFRFRSDASANLPKAFTVTRRVSRVSL